jgi:hypothetical protein
MAKYEILAAAVRGCSWQGPLKVKHLLVIKSVIIILFSRKFDGFW